MKFSGGMEHDPKCSIFFQFDYMEIFYEQLIN